MGAQRLPGGAGSRKRLVAMLLALAASPALGQVATDGSLGTPRLFTGANVTIPSTFGRVAGPNLFHSFQVFNLGRNESATFTGLTNINNVIARITGSGRSEIFGTIRMETGATANLFLLNTQGFLFGPGAAISLPAAFYASSAHHLRFADGTRFSASIADGVTISMAAPAAFTFAGASGPVSVSGATLVARSGAQVGLVGGDVLLERGTGSGVLSAPAGTVALVATRGAGEVAIGREMTPSGFAGMGRVQVLNGTRVSVAEAANASTGSGAIYIRGGEIVIDHARLDANTRRGAGGSIDVGATGTLVTHGAEVLALTVGEGNAGSIRLAGRNVVIDAGALVDASCDPGCTSGDAGSLAVTAIERLVVAGGGEAPTNVISNSFGGGRAGRVTLAAPAIELRDAAFVQSFALAAGHSLGIGITGDSLEITGGAQVGVSSRGAGAGGPLDVTVQSLRIAGYRDEVGTGLVLPSGLFANAEGSGNAGAITVRAGSVRVLDGGEISSSATKRSTGDAGSVTLLVEGDLEVAGFRARDAAGFVGPSNISVNALESGRGGELAIRARDVVVRDHGTIRTLSDGSGDAGRMSLNVRDLAISSGGIISSRAGGTGDAGAIEVRATGAVRLDGAESGIFAETDAQPRTGERGGNGGRIDIAADRLELTEGAVLFARTRGSGDGGTISVVAREIAVDHASRIEAQSLDTSAGGTAPGLAGNITLRTAMLDLQGAVATFSNEADGGNIAITAADRAVIIDGRVTTSVGTGQGNGGNIALDIPTFVLLGARIDANAYGGNGGNIHVGSSTFIVSPGSRVTASSQLGIDGTIVLDSPAIDLAGVLSAPLARFLDNDLVLAGRCVARLAGKSSSLEFAPRAALRESGLAYFLPPATDFCPVPQTPL